MKIYIDENLPPRLAKGLAVLEGVDNGVMVFSIKEVFGRGASDEAWIPLVGEAEGIAITMDYNINRIRAQQELYKKHNLGLFIFVSPNKKVGYGYWAIVEVIIKNWEEIKRLSNSRKRPFAYIHKPKSGFTLLD